MNHLLTVCLMTCGEETEAECLAATAHWPSDVKFQEARGITPAAKALNQMFAQCQTKYLVPLDADMILNVDAYKRIENALNSVSMDTKWHTILFSLWDTLTEEKIYALKVFNMGAMRYIPYPDDPCPDIQHYKDLAAAGLHSIDLFHEQPIGNHVVRGNFYCYAKYRDLYATARSRPRDALESHFKGGKTIREKAISHYKFFQDKNGREEDRHCLYCIGGMLEGLTSPLTYKSKDLSHRNMKFQDHIEFNAIDIAFDEWLEKDKSHMVFV